MLYKRMPIEIESPEEIGYDRIDCNLAESSLADLSFADLSVSLDKLVLGYNDHRGKKELRSLIAGWYKSLQIDDVLVTNGSAAALFMVNTTLLGPGDHLIVIRPNYANNIEVPRAIGCSISFIDLTFEESWKPDLKKIKAAITSSTKLISITTPHNPTGMLIEEQELDELARLAEETNIYLMVDETYRDTCFETAYPPAAIKSKQVISIGSLSKAYGLPGIRIGWLLTQNKSLMDRLLAAKEMIYITNSVLDEEIAYQFLLQKKYWTQQFNRKALENYESLKNWLQKEQRMECILPKGGVVCFPRFKQNLAIDTSRFYGILMNKYRTMVGPGHWFEMPDTYMRVGFGWVEKSILEKGLNNISLTIDESKRAH
jgi:aspartate/methionine/tyrosine aminotransferase